MAKERIASVAIVQKVSRNPSDGASSTDDDKLIYVNNACCRQTGIRLGLFSAGHEQCKARSSFRTRRFGATELIERHHLMAFEAHGAAEQASSGFSGEGARQGCKRILLGLGGVVCKALRRRGTPYLRKACFEPQTRSRAHEALPRRNSSRG